MGILGPPRPPWPRLLWGIGYRPLHAITRYSPLLIFLYVLSKSAAVTEKVDRLGPVVNSWIFEDAPILDERRQYAFGPVTAGLGGR